MLTEANGKKRRIRIGYSSGRRIFSLKTRRERDRQRDMTDGSETGVAQEQDITGTGARRVRDVADTLAGWERDITET